MKNRTLILTLAAVAVLALAAVSFAGPGFGYGHGYHMGGYGMMGQGYGPNANLSTEQRAALDKAYQEFATKTEPLRADLYAKNLELAAELAKSAPDQTRVGDLTKQVNDLNAKLFAEQTSFRAGLAKDYGVRGGYGMGYGMRGGYGPGNCPFRGGDADDRN